MNLHQLAASLRALASYSLGPTTTCNSLHGGDRADTLSQQVRCLHGTDADDARCAPGDGLWNRCY